LGVSHILSYNKKEMDNDFVYHASKNRGLKIIKPRESTHKQRWVYATKDIITSAMFLGNNSDFICQTGVENGKPCIYEQFKGALEHAYAGQQGSIYKVDGKNFKSDQTSWSAEVVSDKAQVVLEEIKIEDSLKFLLKLEKEDKLKIYKYPNKPPHAPKDKGDIIKKAVQWTFDFGESTLDQVKKYHPDVLPEVLKRLKNIRK